MVSLLSVGQHNDAIFEPLRRSPTARTPEAGLAMHACGAASENAKRKEKTRKTWRSSRLRGDFLLSDITNTQERNYRIWEGLRNTLYVIERTCRNKQFY